MTFDLNNLSFIAAKWFKSATDRKVRVIVIHDMEADETQKTAENVANYFKRGDEAQSSAHFCIDAEHVIQCVHLKDVAYAAPGCNSDGIQLELAGYGKQTRGDWLDNYSYKVLVNAADIAAQLCLRYGIPDVHLSNEALAAGQKGIIGHYQASAVYKKSDHTDPGVNFPWDFFIAEVKARIDELTGRNTE